MFTLIFVIFSCFVHFWWLYRWVFSYFLSVLVLFGELLLWNFVFWANFIRWRHCRLLDVLILDAWHVVGDLLHLLTRIEVTNKSSQCLFHRLALGLLIRNTVVDEIQIVLQHRNSLLWRSHITRALLVLIISNVCDVHEIAEVARVLPERGLLVETTGVILHIGSGLHSGVINIGGQIGCRLHHIWNLEHFTDSLSTWEHHGLLRLLHGRALLLKHVLGKANGVASETGSSHIICRCTSAHAGPSEMILVLRDIDLTHGGSNTCSSHFLLSHVIIGRSKAGYHVAIWSPGVHGSLCRDHSSLVALLLRNRLLVLLLGRQMLLLHELLLIDLIVLNLCHMLLLLLLVGLSQVVLVL